MFCRVGRESFGSGQDTFEENQVGGGLIVLLLLKRFDFSISFGHMYPNGNCDVVLSSSHFTIKIGLSRGKSACEKFGLVHKLSLGFCHL